MLGYFDTKYFGNVASMDLLFRLNMSDFFLLNFFFFWTSAWYLLKFLVIMFLSCSLIVDCFTSTSRTLSLLFALLVIISSTSMVSSNYHIVYYYPVDASKVNMLLLNRVNRFHPALFYVSFFVYLTVSAPPSRHKFGSNYLRYRLVTHYAHCFIFLVISLYLGSWWALQEGSWGGWWNWDSSEVFGLCLFYSVARGYHSLLHYTSTVGFRLSSLLSLCLVLSYYFSVQFNFALISHNFGFRNDQFLFETFISACLLVYFVIRARQYCKKQIKLREVSAFRSGGMHVHGLFTPIATHVVLLLALLPLVSNSLHKDPTISATASALALIVSACFFLGFSVRFSLLYFAALTFTSYQTRLALVLPTRSSLLALWFWRHLLVVISVYLIFFCAAKTHVWFSWFGYVLGRCPHAYHRHSALVLGELQYIEIFKKLKLSKIFEWSLYDGSFYHTLWICASSRYPILTTFDHAAVYLAHSVGYLIVLGFLTLLLTSVI